VAIHFLNCFTCCARFPASWRTGTLCLLIETSNGLVLVDTGPGLVDYLHKPGIMRTFQLLTRMNLDPEETAINQVVHLGYQPGDVRHIVLTHMHFDHCGGLPDFPHASVHVHTREYQAFRRLPHCWTELAYVRRHIAHQPNLLLYDEVGERWFDFEAIRLPFELEMWLVPLFGHSRGHCGVAIDTGTGWLFHVSDAAPVGLDRYVPPWLVRLVLGPHENRIRQFSAAHPEVRITTGHMWLDFF
jgi:glyoxylase-like metal-dependent hydrolase (beta-lactamase superfamily II)